MKVTVMSMEPSWKDYDVKEMSLEFYSEVENSDEPIRVYAKFYEDGKIDAFPSLASTYNEPYYYISGGKLMEQIVNFQGEKARELFKKASLTFKKFDDEIEAIYKSEQFTNAHDRNRELNSGIEDLHKKSKRARKEEKKEEYEALIYKLQKERKEIQETIIKPLEEKQRKLKAEGRKALREIVIEL